MVFRIIFAVCSALFSLSCTSHQEIFNSTPTDLRSLSEVEISGTYENKCDSPRTENKRFLWDRLIATQTFRNVNHDYSDSSLVFIRRINEKTLYASLIEQGDTLESIELKGKNEYEYFRVKRKLLLIPIPLFCFIHKERRVLVGIDDDNQLVIKDGGHYYVWIGMHGGSNWITESKYKLH